MIKKYRSYLFSPARRSREFDGDDVVLVALIRSFLGLHLRLIFSFSYCCCCCLLVLFATVWVCVDFFGGIFLDKIFERFYTSRSLAFRFLYLVQVSNWEKEINFLSQFGIYIWRLGKWKFERFRTSGESKAGLEYSISSPVKWFRGLFFPFCLFFFLFSFSLFLSLMGTGLSLLGFSQVGSL